MDYYTKKRASARAQERRIARNQSIKIALKIEACNKIFGKSLDEAETFWTGTIEEQYS